jgi:hypothetical protein
MNKIFFISIMFLLVTKSLLGQSDSTKWTLKINDCITSLGYFYQGEHFFEAGLKIDLIQNKTIQKQNISLLPGIQYTKHSGIAYVNPYVMLRYFKPVSKKIACVFSVSYNYRKILGVTSTSVTPEIGININHVATFSYGYNIFPDNRYTWTLPHRFALRITLH